MVWSTQRPALRRRVVLSVDCLEDRYAPAAIALLGQTAGDFVPFATRIDAVAAPVPAVSAAIASVRLDDIPFGFFHPFCQNGFGGNDAMFEEAPLPQLRPVVPPLDAAQFFLEPDLFGSPIPAAPPAGNESPAPILEAPPAALRAPIPEKIVAPREQPSVQRDDEPASRNNFVDNNEAARPAHNNSRNGFAAIGGLMAAFGLLYTRNARERRYDDAITFGH